jgi:hypothetical protein
MLRPAASETGFRAAPGEAARAARNRMNAMLYKVDRAPAGVPDLS